MQLLVFQPLTNVFRVADKWNDASRKIQGQAAVIEDNFHAVQIGCIPYVGTFVNGSQYDGTTGLAFGNHFPNDTGIEKWGIALDISRLSHQPMSISASKWNRTATLATLWRWDQLTQNG
jgi:hypothetical protein